MPGWPLRATRPTGILALTRGMSALVLASSTASTSAPAHVASARHDPARPIGRVFVDRYLNGPRGFANGGFAAGSIAQHVDSETVSVVLRRPVPVARALDVFDDGDGAVVVRDGGKTIARGFPSALAAGPAPTAPSFADAQLARARHPLAGVRHPLSDCVVCGPRRLDGMHVTPGALAGRRHELAAPWTVTSAFSHAGSAWYAAVWGALDCTSYPAVALEQRVVCLLGTMTARIERRPLVGEHLVVHSWTRETSGRRYETSVAMTDERGDEVARADATWIAVARRGLASVIRWLR